MRPEVRDIGKQIEILQELKDYGIEKLNIVGGEPQLHPNFEQILKLSKEFGFTIALQTNGSMITQKNLSALEEYVDWIGISIDSGIEKTELCLGRGFGNHVSTVKEVCKLIQKTDIKLKINTTVTSLNYNENMTELIKELDPLRWKVFKVLILEGTNEDADYLSVSKEEYQKFIDTHSSIPLRNGNKPVFESDDQMCGSYLMVSPDGMIQTNINKKLEYYPISELNCKTIEFMREEKYIQRGAIYEWK